MKYKQLVIVTAIVASSHAYASTETPSELSQFDATLKQVLSETMPGSTYDYSVSSMSHSTAPVAGAPSERIQLLDVEINFHRKGGVGAYAATHTTTVTIEKIQGLFTPEKQLAYTIQGLRFDSQEPQFLQSQVFAAPILSAIDNNGGISIKHNIKVDPTGNMSDVHQMKIGGLVSFDMSGSYRSGPLRGKSLADAASNLSTNYQSQTINSFDYKINDIGVIDVVLTQIAPMFGMTGLTRESAGNILQGQMKQQSAQFAGMPNSAADLLDDLGESVVRFVSEGAPIHISANFGKTGITVAQAQGAALTGNYDPLLKGIEIK